MSPNDQLVTLAAKEKRRIGGRKKGDFRKTDKIALSLFSFLKKGSFYRAAAKTFNISVPSFFRMVQRFKSGHYDEMLKPFA